MRVEQQRIAFGGLETTAAAFISIAVAEDSKRNIPICFCEARAARLQTCLRRLDLPNNPGEELRTKSSQIQQPISTADLSLAMPDDFRTNAEFRQDPGQLYGRNRFP